MLSFGRCGRLFYSVRTRIQSDLLAALKSNDKPRASVLRQIQAELVKFEKGRSSGTSTPQESDWIGVIQGCAERWSKAIQEYQKLAKDGASGREADIQAIIAKESGELALIKEYLPAPYSQEELDEIVKKTAEELALASADPSKLGVLMKGLLERIDTARISRKDLASLAQKHLSSLNA